LPSTNEDPPPYLWPLALYSLRPATRRKELAEEWPSCTRNLNFFAGHQPSEEDLTDYLDYLEHQGARTTLFPNRYFELGPTASISSPLDWTPRRAGVILKISRVLFAGTCLGTSKIIRPVGCKKPRPKRSLISVRCARNRFAFGGSPQHCPGSRKFHCWMKKFPIPFLPAIHEELWQKLSNWHVAFRMTWNLTTLAGKPAHKARSAPKQLPANRNCLLKELWTGPSDRAEKSGKRLLGLSL